MSSGTFGYPLCFAAMLAVIGLVVSGGPIEKPRQPQEKTTDSGYWGATKNEIRQEIIARCDDYFRKYPDAENRVELASLAIQLFLERGDLMEAGRRSMKLAKQFPDSVNRGDFVFFEGLALFQAGDVPGAIKRFRRVLIDDPHCGAVRSARHYLARSYFLRDHEGSTDIPEWLRRAPGPFCEPDVSVNPFAHGKSAERCCYYGSPAAERREDGFVFGEDGDQPKDCIRMIRVLGEHLTRHPDSAGFGSTMCLLGRARETTGDEAGALEAYRKAAMSECPDDVAALALESAAALLLSREGRGAVAGLCRDFLKHRPETLLTAVVASDLAKIAASEGNDGEARQVRIGALGGCIGDPAAVRAEFLIDEFVKSLVPRKKSEDLDADALDKQLVEMLGNAGGPNPNATTTARIYYARARLARLLKLEDRCELYLKGIALNNLKDPSALSPTLLSVSGDTLLKSGDADGAEKMFQWLKDHHAAGFGNVGSIGLGNVALARKKPEDALKFFNGVLENQPAPPEITGATVGKLQALVDLNKDDEAVKLALEAVANNAFKGESTARVYLLLGWLYEKKAAAGGDAKEFLQKALAIYQRVLVGYPGYPELSKEALRRSDEVKKKL